MNPWNGIRVRQCSIMRDVPSPESLQRKPTGRSGGDDLAGLCRGESATGRGAGFRLPRASCVRLGRRSDGGLSGARDALLLRDRWGGRDRQQRLRQSAGAVEGASSSWQVIRKGGDRCKTKMGNPTVSFDQSKGVNKNGQEGGYARSGSDAGGGVVASRDEFRHIRWAHNSTSRRSWRWWWLYAVLGTVRDKPYHLFRYWAASLLQRSKLHGLLCHRRLEEMGML